MDSLIYRFLDVLIIDISIRYLDFIFRKGTTAVSVSWFENRGGGPGPLCCRRPAGSINGSWMAPRRFIYLNLKVQGGPRHQLYPP